MTDLPPERARFAMTFSMIFLVSSKFFNCFFGQRFALLTIAKMARSAAVGRKKKSTKPPKRKAEDVEDDHEDSGASATVQVSKMRWDHLPSGRELSRTWSYFSDIPEECKTETGCIMGIDEAGRGPVLGNYTLRKASSCLCSQSERSCI